MALGRLALEPLAVLASLCRSDGMEILSLNLHPLQSHVPESELLKAADRSLMTVVAQVLDFPPACKWCIACSCAISNFDDQADYGSRSISKGVAGREK